MKNTVYPGFYFLLVLALAIPALAALAQQPEAKSRAEYDAYNAFYTEQNPQKKAELGEKFLTAYKDSDFRLDAYTLLVRAYTQSQNWAKVMDVAERFTAAFPSADVIKKVFVFENAMTAAQQANNFDKIVAYGDKVLAVAPDNLNAQITLSSMLPERLPQDEAAKKAALDKAYDLATKAMAQVQRIFGQPKPANFTDDQWNRERANLEGQLHATMGLVHLNRMEYQQAADEYETAIKSNPRDGVSRFRLGLAYQYLASDASKQLVEAINAENAAKAARADRALVDELVAKREAAEGVVRERRDKAIDELAKAVAIGGVVAQSARDQLERLYKAKNNESLEGLEQLIDEKKSQLSSTP